MYETHSEPTTCIATVLLRISSDPRILMIDGYDCRLVIRSKQLHITDGIDSGRRTRIVSKTDGIRRIVILSDSGFVTLDAIRWCESEGIAIVQYGEDGNPV